MVTKRRVLLVVILTISLSTGAATASILSEDAQSIDSAAKNQSQNCDPQYFQTWESEGSDYHTCLTEINKTNSTILLHNDFRTQGPAYSPTHVVIPAVLTSGEYFQYSMEKENYDEGRVHAIDVDDGSLSWTGGFEGTYKQVYVTDASVYVVSTISVTKYRLETGEKIWSEKMNGRYASDTHTWVRKNNNMTILASNDRSVILNDSSGDIVIEYDHEVRVTYTNDEETNVLSNRGLTKFDSNSVEVIQTQEQIDRVTHWNLVRSPTGNDLYRTEDYLYFVDNSDLSVNKVPIGDDNLHIEHAGYRDGEFQVSILELESERSWSNPRVNDDGGGGGAFNTVGAVSRQYEEDGTLDQVQQKDGLTDLQDGYFDSYPGAHIEDELRDSVDKDVNETTLEFDTNLTHQPFKQHIGDYLDYIEKTTTIKNHTVVLNSSMKGTARHSAIDENLTVTAPNGNTVFSERFDGFSGLIRYGESVVFVKSSINMEESYIYQMDIIENTPPDIENSPDMKESIVRISDENMQLSGGMTIPSKSLQIKYVDESGNTVNEKLEPGNWSDLDTELVEVRNISQSGVDLELIPPSHLEGDVSVTLVYADEFGETAELNVSYERTEKRTQTETGGEGSENQVQNTETNGDAALGLHTPIIALVAVVLTLFWRESYSN